MKFTCRLAPNPVETDGCAGGWLCNAAVSCCCSTDLCLQLPTVAVVAVEGVGLWPAAGAAAPAPAAPTGGGRLGAAAAAAAEDDPPDVDVFEFCWLRLR